MGFDALYIPALFEDLELLRKHDNSTEKFMRAVEAKPKMNFKETMALMDMAQGAFYDPDPSAVPLTFACRSIPTRANSSRSAGPIG